MNRHSRPIPPRDEDREQLQGDLTRLVGAGRLQFDEFDRLCDVVWSTQDKSVLDHIRAQYLTYQPGPPAAPMQQPPMPNSPVPMAQPGAHMAMPVGNQPVISTMGEIRRTGQWTVPEHSSFRLNGSTVKLDLRQAQASAPVCTFDFQANMSTISIIVPPGVYVENRLKDALSTVNVETTQPHPNAPRVVLTGVLRGCSLKVITRAAPDTSSLWHRFFGA
ncbi:MAG: DUF1707 domain-containing protein [Corynebacterium sp.]|uniref:DUF1707 domain-containing protein n=1 Tax=Corynebacterium sp. TaxID=1720 RepID=UPI0026E0DA83|nr:DUF1707 domain-containing protein [Corynebacterium sp.]MDO5670855.1 DUF1707 domain-containing protein [Corynebacterium sp.]